MPPKNPKPGYQFAKVIGYIKDMFDQVTQQFLPTEKNSLNIGWESLPAIYRESVRAHGGLPDPTTEDSLVEVAQAYLDSVKVGMEADLRHTLITHEKSKKDDSTVDVAGMVQKVMDTAEFEVKRVVDSEAQRARSTGAFEGVLQTAAKIGIDDPVVFWIVRNDSILCGECRRLHLMPDGKTPRVWKMSEISKGYHKKGNDSPCLAGLHPHCFTGNMRLHIDGGMRTFKELFGYDGEHLNVVVDKRIKARRVGNNQKGAPIPGTSWFDRHSSGSELRHSTNVFDTGVRNCLRITLDTGHQIEVSEDHEMWVDGGNSPSRKVAARDLVVDMKIPLISGPTPFGEDHFPTEAEAMGSLMGDGFINETNNGDDIATLHFFGKEIEYGMRLRALLGEKFPSMISKETPNIQPPNDKYQVEHWNFGSAVLGRYVKEHFGFTKKPRTVPERLWTADKDTVSAFLRGLFSADGHSELWGVILAQNDKNLLIDVQRLLSMFGIVSRIYPHGEATDKVITYADGRQFNTHRKACWRLRIGSNRQIKLWAEEIGFGPKYKQEKVWEFFNKTGGVSKVCNNWRVGFIEKIEDIGPQQTYSITEPLTNSCTVNAIVTGQCRCSLTICPPGYGYDSAGNMIYKYEGYDEWARQRGLEEAASLE